MLLLLKVSGAHMVFPLHFHELEGKESQLIFEDDKVTVTTIPLDHRIYANGFLFKEKNKERKLNVDAVQQYGIDVCYYQNIKNGKDILLDSGECIPNELLSFPPAPPQSYAFCSDTIYRPEIVPLIKGVQVLYHESTFLEDNRALAEKTKHSTALQAAQIAQAAGVQTLILGHYSSRYKDKRVFQEEAQTLFPNTLLSEDGKEFNFND